MAQLAPGVVIYTCNKAPDRRAENKEEAATKHKLSLSLLLAGRMRAALATANFTNGSAESGKKRERERENDSPFHCSPPNACRKCATWCQTLLVICIAAESQFLVLM